MHESSLLPATWNVPTEFVDRLGKQVGRQRTMIAEGHLLIILHAPPQPEDMYRKGRLFWREPDANWHSSEFKGGPNALNWHLDEYQQLLEDFDEKVDQATSSLDYLEVLNHLGPVYRALCHMTQALQMAREAIPKDKLLIDFRDNAYRLERTAELLIQDAKNALEYVVARQAEEQAKVSARIELSSHRLNLLIAYFFPIATLSTIFGSNFRHGYEKYQTPYPFWIMVGTGLALGFLIHLFLKRAPRKQRQ
ncbi:CorA-like Mg2+ transporter protein [Gimesia alba]|uniref:CorA-like Mg2+ transporter protein n=1 Tax=Gimesia alba TaxID=2527973 RepID=A0A517RGV3_9PLAN|nr:CorA family divalent cation transporter [Gimesia alba]QDT43093.1 CorA-like Mg2+ transporter protein [Gimesia alba]